MATRSAPVYPGGEFFFYFIPPDSKTYQSIFFFTWAGDHDLTQRQMRNERGTIEFYVSIDP